MSAAANQTTPQTRAVFETVPVPNALMKMAIPTVASQLITLVYNLSDTWFIARTDNPFMVAACSLSATLFLLTIAITNLFGTGGGTLAVRLMGARREEEARKVAAFSLIMAGGAALAFSLIILCFMDPLLHLLGASENTLGYARQYLFFTAVLGGVPTVLSGTMSSMVRNTGHSKEAGFGLSMGGILNIILDPIFMFVLLPDGYEVMGAAIATMLSNVASFVYFIFVYRKLKDKSILAIPRKLEKIERASVKSLFSVGLPAASSMILFDLTNMVINRLVSGHGDIALAAIGLVLKVERLPLNIGIGICLGMVPLMAYNYASGNRERMQAFFSVARIAGLAIALASVVLYRLGAPYIIKAFMSDAETVALATQFLKARCIATPLMFLSFHMVHSMQALNRGKVSFALAVIRQLALNIPILFLMNHLFGAMGIVWTQATADLLNVAASYLIYHQVKKKL